MARLFPLENTHFCFLLPTCSGLHNSQLYILWRVLNIDSLPAFKVLEPLMGSIMFASIRIIPFNTIPLTYIYKVQMVQSFKLWVIPIMQFNWSLKWHQEAITRSSKSGFTFYFLPRGHSILLLFYQCAQYNIRAKEGVTCWSKSIIENIVTKLKVLDIFH